MHAQETLRRGIMTVHLLCPHMTFPKMGPQVSQPWELQYQSENKRFVMSVSGAWSCASSVARMKTYSKDVKEVTANPNTNPKS